jgi:antitoxin (DNA-binding transcriptional repressor) of toxin-antitoxin stability system
MADSSAESLSIRREPTSITEAEFLADFGATLKRASAGETFVIIRDGKPIVYLVSIEDHEFTCREVLPYSAMSADKEREREATEWAEAHILDLDDDMLNPQGGED